MQFLGQFLAPHQAAVDVSLAASLVGPLNAGLPPRGEWSLVPHHGSKWLIAAATPALETSGGGMAHANDELQPRRR